MNKKNLKIIISILTLLILITTIPSFAANNTTASTQTNSTANVTKNTTSSNTTSVKSSEANLSNLGITPHDFSGFKESITQYDVSVPNNTTQVEVYAKKKNSKSTVTGTGKVNLKEGENQVKVVVTAEDGKTTKTYTINIKRLKAGEKQTQVTATNLELGLEKLEIEGQTIEPGFSKDVYQYRVQFEGDQEKLNIIAQANEEGAIIKTIGNEKLVNGQNVITILVTNSKESQVVTYQIYANKNMVEQQELDNHFNEAQMKQELKEWIVIGLIVIIFIGIIILMILRHKRQDEEEYRKERINKNVERVKEKKQKRQKKEKKSGKHSK